MGKWVDILGVAPHYYTKTRKGRTLKYWNVGQPNREIAERMVVEFNLKLKASNINGKACIREADVDTYRGKVRDINVMIYIKE
jgi:hypothetical protein